MEDSTRRLYRARKTCCEMLQDRGYIVPTQEKAETWHDFLQRFQENEKNRSRMLLVAAHKLDPDDRVIVYFADETKKTGVKPIRELTERMEERNIQRAILVTQNVLTAFARDAITEAAPRHIIENFMESELLVNITKHELVPKHVPLTADEKQSLLNRYRVKEVQLPRIQCSDPVARYFGLHRGQTSMKYISTNIGACVSIAEDEATTKKKRFLSEVVKIIRSSETAGRYVTYRLVV